MAIPTTPRIQGIWIPLITPFRDGELDEVSARRLVARYASQRIDGLILAATTGEGLTLDAEETERLVAVAAETAEGRLPLFLGLSGSDTRALIGALERVRDWPIDGTLIACPCYVRPAQEGLYRHFAALAEASARPVLVYNIPYRTGVNLANETLLRLAALPNIVGLKDCCADPAQSFDLLRDRPPGFAVMTGEDALFHAALAQGADGGILASAHVETAAFAGVRERMVANDQASALNLWRVLIEVPRLLFAAPSPAPLKHWLWRRGLIDSPELRLPMVGIDQGLAARIDAMIARRQGVETAA